VTGLKASLGDGSWKAFHCDLVVGADGRNSGIARLVEAPMREFPNERFAVFAYYDGVTLKSGDNSQFWFFGDKSVFAYPLFKDSVLLCLFLPLSEKDEWLGDIDEKFLEEYRSLDKAPDLDSAKRSTDFHRMMDMTSCYRNPSGKGVALVGDAALQSDPMSGIGCGWAILSSYWLFQETRHYVKHPVMRNVGISRYGKLHKRRLLPHNKFIVQSSFARGHGFLEVLLFKAGARNQHVADLIGDFVGRKIEVSEFLSPGNIVRYIAAAALPARKTAAS
ncbi:MAG: FAD-dependent monooxygenase, partial [Moraxellaceae bacterium]|nr:FAD-dependent monooxygenase [Moraxellaceae bacterium]